MSGSPTWTEPCRAMHCLAAFAASLIAIAAPLQATCRAQSPGRPLCTSVLTLTEATPGGFIGSFRTRVVTISYDWNRGRYRAVEWKVGEAVGSEHPSIYRTCGLSKEQFRSVLDGVYDLGLAALSTEDRPGEEDIYGRGVIVAYLHRDERWRNSLQDACQGNASIVQPTPAERKRFDAVIAHIERSLGALEMQSASALDASAAVIEDPMLASRLPIVVEWLRADPRFETLDFNRMFPTVIPPAPAWSNRKAARPSERIDFAFREQQHDLCNPMNSTRRVTVTDLLGSDLRVEVAPDYGPATPVERERRAAYVAAHPDLEVGARELILNGWIGDGMTPDQVAASWGEPVECRELRDGIHASYRRFARSTVQLVFQGGRLTRLPGEIRVGP